MSPVDRAQPPDGFRIECIEVGEALRPGAGSLLARCHAIRRTVFVDEQSVPADIEWDDFDDEAEHFLLYGERAADSVALGTARVRFFETYAKAERVAVLAEARGQGLGRALMKAVEASARRKGQHTIRLSAQLTALAFYETLEYVAQGDVFAEAGIDHRAMSKRLE